MSEPGSGSQARSTLFPDRATALPPKRWRLRPGHYDLASIHAARGETERALAWLERSCEAGWLQYELLRLDPLFDPLRGDERFEAVGEAMEREVREQRMRIR